MHQDSSSERMRLSTLCQHVSDVRKPVSIHYMICSEDCYLKLWFGMSVCQDDLKKHTHTSCLKQMVLIICGCFELFETTLWSNSKGSLKPAHCSMIFRIFLLTSLKAPKETDQVNRHEGHAHQDRGQSLYQASSSEVQGWAAGQRAGESGGPPDRLIGSQQTGAGSETPGVEKKQGHSEL